MLSRWLPSLAIILLPTAILMAPPHDGTPDVPTIEQRIVAEALAAGVPPRLALMVARRESGMNPLAVGRNKDGSHDWGLGQINDRTVKLLHVTDPLDVSQNIIAFVGVLGMGLDHCRSEAGALRYYARGRCK